MYKISKSIITVAIILLCIATAVSATMLFLNNMISLGIACIFSLLLVISVIVCVLSGLDEILDNLNEIEEFLEFSQNKKNNSAKSDVIDNSAKCKRSNMILTQKNSQSSKQSEDFDKLKNEDTVEENLTFDDEKAIICPQCNEQLFYYPSCDVSEIECPYCNKKVRLPK
jgi:hypothetical protein